MIRTHTFRHPQIGLMIVDASVTRFEWARTSMGRTIAFVDADKPHPYRVPAVIYDVNTPIHGTMLNEYNAISGPQIAEWLTAQVRIASASKLLGFESE